ncbi:hypothetical protein KB879_35420 (plasmid) [Cupriavidus sp. KK10]|uniref:hypothetical protein n=1 Tax=Cupriavidus sp. KK10 TaxID=1478019 RepID=UPI001BA85E37|nr:hypothetical protein [Cupriavidus sp. KK10]QUN31664.1 hypothetical protein KB879_35420 [Cupriavidus sp. KK10]
MDTRRDPMRRDADQVGALQLEPLTMKLFSARWDTSFEQRGEKVQLERDFTTDAGYSAEDIERIPSLKVGESWTCPDYGRSHTVTRLLDGDIPEVRTEYIQKYLSPRIPNDAKEAQRVLDGFESKAQVEAMAGADPEATSDSGVTPSDLITRTFGFAKSADAWLRERAAALTNSALARFRSGSDAPAQVTHSKPPAQRM